MAKIKHSMTKERYEEAAKGGVQSPPPPGVYLARVVDIKDVTPDNGKGRRLEIVWEIARGDYAKRRRTVYIPFGESSQWKMDQFYVAIGLAKPGKYKEVVLDTDKVSALPLAQIRVKADSYNDEPSWDINAMLPYDPDEDEEDDTEPEEPEDADEEEVDEDEPTDEYDGMSLAALRKEAKGRELDTKGLDKNGLVELLRENDGAEDEDEDEEDEDEEEPEEDEDEDEDDDEDEDEEEEEDDEPEDYNTWTLTNLRKEFTDRKLKLPRGKKIREVTKAYLVKKLVASDEDPVGDE